MHQDAPTLVLSDIVHGLTPSPAPQDDPHSRSPSPEVLHEHQVAAIRKTALDLSVASISSRERELVDMVRIPDLFYFSGDGTQTVHRFSS